jgi:CRP/FNR family transcriptional regulator, cyclic AMP receptor protein
VVDQTRVESVASLAALPPEIKADLAEAFDEISVPAGERIVSQGDFAYELFAIVEGTARVEQDGLAIATLGPGDLFGEIGLMLTGRRTGAIVAETPMQLLALFEQTFRRLSREHPELAEVVHAQSRGRFSRSSAV